MFGETGALIVYACHDDDVCYDVCYDDACHDDTDVCYDDDDDDVCYDDVFAWHDDDDVCNDDDDVDNKDSVKDNDESLLFLLHSLTHSLIGHWNGTSRHPEILVVHLGLHTCVHSSFSPTSQNKTMINQHKADLKLLMAAIKIAINRTPSSLPRTMVIIQLAGRAGW